VNLVLIEPDELTQDNTARVSGVRRQHIREVLRVSDGATLRVGIVNGPRGTAVVRSMDDNVVELGCTFEATVQDRPAVDLVLALPRPKVMRRLFAQIAALGVGRIILTNAARVERDYFDAHILSPAVYRPLLIEGLQQARDTRLPSVTIHRQFRILVEDELDVMVPEGGRMVAQPGEAPPIAEHAASSGAQRIVLAVGPEGGWNEFELTLMKKHGFLPISLGTRTLRSDTACVALLTLAHDALRRAGGTSI
jgi:16S rRNA (uracil1498-N3)-methyltransferase